jgi:hypothetical protein
MEHINRRWANPETYLTSVQRDAACNIGMILLTGYLSDFTVIVEDEPFYLHRRILTKESDLFASLFRVRPDYIKIDLTKGIAWTSEAKPMTEPKPTAKTELEPHHLRADDFASYIECWYEINEYLDRRRPSLFEYPALRHAMDDAGRYLGNLEPIELTIDDAISFKGSRLDDSYVDTVTLVLCINGDTTTPVENGTYSLNVVYKPTTTPIYPMDLVHENTTIDISMARFSPAAILALFRCFDQIFGDTVPYRINELAAMTKPGVSQFKAKLVDPTGKLPEFDVVSRLIVSDCAPSDRYDLRKFLEELLKEAINNTFLAQLEDEESSL